MKLNQAQRTAPDTLVLERFLPYRLSVLANRVSSALARLYAERFDLSVPEWRVMAVLGRFPHLSATEIADRSAMDKVTVSRAVQRLEQAGRLTREVHPGDRRRQALAFTPAGASIYAQIVPLAREFEQQMLAALNGRDMMQFDAALDRLLAQFSDGTAPDGPRIPPPV